MVLTRQIIALRWLLLVAVMLWIGAFFNLPSPLRAYVPTWFGMTQIAENVYTDDPSRRDQILQTIDEGETQLSAFFGTLKAEPWVIVCTTNACDDRFATHDRAFAFRDRFVLVGNGGLHSLVIAHELVHAELYTRSDAKDDEGSFVPAWLNEGLAAYLSNDYRLPEIATPDALWVLEAEEHADWHRLLGQRSWTETYGAAQSLVASLDAELGRDGLITFVETLQSGATPVKPVTWAISQ